MDYLSNCNKNSGCFREMAVRGSSTVPLSHLCDGLKKILMYSPSLKSTIISLSKKNCLHYEQRLKISLQLSVGQAFCCKIQKKCCSLSIHVATCTVCMVPVCLLEEIQRPSATQR